MMYSISKSMALAGLLMDPVSAYKQTSIRISDAGYDPKIVIDKIKAIVGAHDVFQSADKSWCLDHNVPAIVFCCGSQGGFYPDIPLTMANYDKAKDLCEKSGSRFCTSEELVRESTKQPLVLIPMVGDYAAWTSKPCDNRSTTSIMGNHEVIQNAEDQGRCLNDNYSAIAICCGPQGSFHAWSNKFTTASYDKVLNKCQSVDADLCTADKLKQELSRDDSKLIKMAGRYAAWTKKPCNPLATTTTTTTVAPTTTTATTTIIASQTVFQSAESSWCLKKNVPAIVFCCGGSQGGFYPDVVLATSTYDGAVQMCAKSGHALCTNEDLVHESTKDNPVLIPMVGGNAVWTSKPCDNRKTTTIVGNHLAIQNADNEGTCLNDLFAAMVICCGQNQVFYAWNNVYQTSSYDEAATACQKHNNAVLCTDDQLKMELSKDDTKLIPMVGGWAAWTSKPCDPRN